MKITKSRVHRILLSAGCIAVACIAGVSAALLVHNTQARTNDFQFQNAKIELTETDWDTLTDTDKIVYPQRSVKKNPIITNVGDVEVYAYIEVTVPRQEVRLVNTNEQINTASWQNLFSFVTNSGWEQIGSDEVSTDNTSIKRTYAYTLEPLKPGESTPSLFDTIQFANIVEGDVPMGTKLQVNVEGVAIQSQFLDEEGDTQKDKMEDAYKKYLQERERT